MLAIVMRADIGRFAMPSPINSTAWLSTSSLLKSPHKAMMTSFPTTPGERLPLSTTFSTGGTWHHVTLDAQILAASVRMTRGPYRDAAPYKLDCVSLDRTKAHRPPYAFSNIYW